MIPQAAAVPDVPLIRALFGDRPRGARPALVSAVTGRTLTYAGLESELQAAAAGLAETGLGAGSVVAVYQTDGPDFVLATLAASAAGATVAVIGPGSSADTVARRLAECGAAAVVSEPRLLGVALQAAKEAGTERVLCVGDGRDVAEPFTGLFRPHPPAVGDPARPASDPRTSAALVAWTRGRGRPVRLTHRNLVAGFLRVAETGLLGPGDTVLSGLPYADVLGLSGLLLPALRAGATAVAAGTGRHELSRALRDYCVTVALLTPAQVEVLAFDETAGRHDPHALRSVVSVGGPLPPETARACAVRLGCDVHQAYGLAETAGVTHLNVRAARERTLDSVGAGLPLVTWRVADPVRGTGMAAYQPGELWIRGPMVTGQGPDGWLRTGDAAFADEHGRLYVMGRIGGDAAEESRDARSVLAAFPGVADAVVVPVPDREHGLVAHAFVVAARPGAVAPAALLAHVNQHVPAYQQVTSVHLVDVIPRSPSGRVMRRALIQRARLPFLEG